MPRVRNDSVMASACVAPDDPHLAPVDEEWVESWTLNRGDGTYRAGLAYRVFRDGMIVVYGGHHLDGTPSGLPPVVLSKSAPVGSAVALAGTQSLIEAWQKEVPEFLGALIRMNSSSQSGQHDA